MVFADSQLATAADVSKAQTVDSIQCVGQSVAIRWQYIVTEPRFIQRQMDSEMTNTERSSIGILHPGQMGISLAAALVNNGYQVCWASEGRSAKSCERAAKHELQDCGELMELSSRCQILFSICPPAEALRVATLVIDTGFNGIYVDCNAIAPSTSRAIADKLIDANVDYVDGGVIGPPAWKAGTTRLYLSGQKASDIGGLYSGSVMDTVVLGDKTDAASAMKMAYAAWTKGSAALLLNVFALAKAHELESPLLEEWALSQPGLHSKLESAALGNAPKGWRFVGEMQQIAKSLNDVQLHPGAFDSAAEVYQALSEFKGASAESITADAVIAAILSVPEEPAT